MLLRVVNKKMSPTFALWRNQREARIELRYHFPWPLYLRSLPRVGVAARLVRLLRPCADFLGVDSIVFLPVNEGAFAIVFC